ncbi:alanine racemase [Novosphingobium decolorationis]|uniref:alanine racemase n=1 Tax=Novosphingobium decolorationis TaxID=2698673 RepID=A0ABX8E0W3_9SPHN|nr:alanine racemase [Novosphingobium decolorationis]QVM82568.1 alanine racemase [Novosphingobium decolorationis]
MHPERPQAPLRLDFDDDALIANWKALDRLSGAARAGAAVKANAYGTGARHAVPLLLEAGCRDFFVAHWGEVADAVPAVDPGMVSVLHGPLTQADAAFAKACGVKPVINSLAQARRWLAAGGGRCDLMVDTGMNRLGVAMDELGDPALAQLDVDVLLSHLVASEEDTPLNEVQRSRWMEARGALTHRRASLANSAGIGLGEAYHGDLTRPGLGLYGGLPRAEMAPHLRQVVRPQVAVLQVRDLEAGQSVGYNATFTAPRAMRVGALALGYADGFLRCWSGKGMFRDGEGAALPVLGRVSMDLTVVDLGAAPHVREGDWLTLDYSLPEASEVSGLTQYELLTSLGRRFGR